MSLSHNLTRLMERRGLSQEALADALGVSHRAVGGWLAGAKPRASVARQLADFFGVPLAVFGSLESAPLPSDPELTAHEEPSRYGREFEAHLQRLRLASRVSADLFPGQEKEATLIFDALFEALTRIETRLARIENATTVERVEPHFQARPAPYEATLLRRDPSAAAGSLRANYRP